MYCPLLNFYIVLIAENDVLNIQDFVHQYFNILYLKGTFFQSRQTIHEQRLPNEEKKLPIDS